jgi:hypothetical protein
MYEGIDNNMEGWQVHVIMQASNYNYLDLLDLLWIFKLLW